ncbi:MAG: tetratricopeptide repeat protein [Planctomycetes bacterium]|nr:tetratricopeptide repeat protein [Planctomycetota bacterium]
MAIHFKCPQCGKQQDVPDYSVGKVFKCGCGQTLVVPGEGKVSGLTFLMFAVIAVTVPMFYYLLFARPLEVRDQSTTERLAVPQQPVDEPASPSSPDRAEPPASDTAPREVEFLRPPVPLPVAGNQTKISPKQAAALKAIRLGDGAFAEGAYGDALAQYRRAAALDSENCDAEARVVTALFNVGRHDEAIDEAREMLRTDPGNACASYLLGCMQRRVGALPDALTRLRAAVELDPENFAARHELATVLDQMGRHQEAIGQWYEAVAACRKLLAEGRTDARFRIELGTFLGRVGNASEADRHLKAAAAQSQNDAGLQYLLAMAYGELGRTREAQRHALAARVLGHRNAEKLLKELGPPSRTAAP